MAGGVWSVAEAKAKLSEVMSRAGTEGPQTLLRNGRPVAVMVSAADWAKVEARPTLVDIMADESFSILEPEEVETLFGRANRQDSPARD